jgi:hypothetical protein
VIACRFGIGASGSEHPTWFRMEFETAGLDLEWLASLEAGYEARYEEVKRAREGQEERRVRALRQELELKVARSRS